MAKLSTKTIILSMALIVFTACSGGKSSNTNNGISNTNNANTSDTNKTTTKKEERLVTHGPLQENGFYRCDYTKGDAMLIEQGTKIIPIEDNTKLRLWHKENSNKYACVRKGKAKIEN